MADQSEPSWKEPAQARAHESMERTLDAAQQLLETVHFNELKVKEVCRRAGTSIGSFYNRFKTKEGLMQELEKRYARERSRLIADGLEGRDWSDVNLAGRVQWLSESVVRFNRESRGLVRTFRVQQLLDSGPCKDSELADRRAAFGLYTEFLLERRREIQHPDPERAVNFSFISMLTTLDQLMLFDHTMLSSLVEATDEELVEQVARQMLAYLSAASA